MKKVVIGIPIFNEELLIDELVRRTILVMNSLLEKYETELLFINDGSGDKSLEMLKKYAESDKRIKVITFSRNFGLEAAISCIIASFEGDALVVIDGDLQDPPELIPDLIKKWEAGFDVVYTVKKSRKEVFYMRALFNLFYRIQTALSDIKIPAQAGNFSLIDKKVVSKMKTLKEKGKYFPGLRTWCGFNQTSLYYDRDKRFAGEAKMTMKKLFTLALNGIFSYTKIPGQISYFLGLFFILTGFLYVVYVIVSKIIYGKEILGWASTIMTIYIIGGFIMLSIALLGEYIVRIFDQTRDRPEYIVMDEINMEKGKKV